MIYINQIGTCELGRGETLEEAILNANKCGFEIKSEEIEEFREQWIWIDGKVIWTSEPMEGYNYND